MRGEKLTVYRGATDRYGNASKSAYGVVEGVLSSGRARRDSGSGKRSDGSTRSSELFVARGADLKARDRVERANGEQYAVVGPAEWDQNFPFDGFNFGVMVFQLEAING